MSDIIKQRTLKAPVTLSGVGLHTGKESHVTIKPAPADTWFVFKRMDLPCQPEIKALAEYVGDTSRGTTLEKDGVLMVATIEHFLSALVGLEIDNAIIETDSPEMPILDGSARLITEAILKAGICEQEAERRYYDLRKPFTFRNEEKGIEIKAVPSDKREFTVKIDYNSAVIVPQYASIDTFGDRYAEEIAKCRTFVFLREVEFLHSQNLIKGGDLDNAIVFVDRKVEQEEINRLASLFNKPAVAVKEGILNNVDLHFKNEPARHKLLDLIGDCALLGCYMHASVDALRPGHFSNTEFIKQIRKQMQKDMAPEALPPFDITATPLYDVNGIKKILPHRPPFLLVDKIVYMDKDQVVGVKNVTMNEPFFTGHFPDEPVMPGVLIIEAMAQTGGIYMLTQYPDPENYLTYFLKMDNVKFRHKVVPGDTLIFKLTPISPLRRGLCNMKGWAYVGDQIVAEADMLAQLARKPDAPALEK